MNKKLSELDFVKNICSTSLSDRGLSLGCALYASNLNNIKIEKANHVYYGPSYSDDFIKQQIKISNLKYQEIDNPHEMPNFLSEGKIIAWHNGRSEFGPRL